VSDRDDEERRKELERPREAEERQRELERLREAEERRRERERSREAEAEERRRRDEDAVRSSVCTHGYVRGKCPKGC
jgi:hypothetical protein